VQASTPTIDVMTTTTTTNTSNTSTTTNPTPPRLGDVVYRFRGELGALNPVGLFAEGIRFHNQFEGRIVDGPFAGGRISGPDFFVLRHDGVGEIHAPELIELGHHRVAVDVRGYVVPPAGLAMPPLVALLEPGFEFPDLPFRITASALASTTSPEFDWLNATSIVVEGAVNMATGDMDVTARAVDAPFVVDPSDYRG
jgi:hypothetical protein